MKTHASLVVSNRSSFRVPPSSVRTRGGVTFNPTADVWSYREGVKRVHIDFSPLAAALSAEMLRSFKIVLLWYVENSSGDHLLNMHRRFFYFVNYLFTERPVPIDRIESIDLLNYKTALSADIAWYLAGLSVFLKKWHGLKQPGVTDDAIALLRDLRVKGNAGANRWVEHQERTLTRFDKLCAVLDDPNVPLGSVIQPSGIVPASRLDQAGRERGLQRSAVNPIGLSAATPNPVPTDNAVEP